MILLVASAARRVAGGSPLIGDFVTPKGWNHLGKTDVWAADNGAFSGLDEAAFTTMLDRIAENSGVLPKFITVPDVVCSHRLTVELWLQWARRFRERRLPRAFVLQNGIEGNPPEFGLPWHNVEALFIGGDTAFKFSPWVRAAVHFARRAGIWVHMGRVNSIRRLNYAREIGCDSCDGSGMAKFPKSTLLPMLRSLRSEQLTLF